MPYSTRSSNSISCATVFLILPAIDRTYGVNCSQMARLFERSSLPSFLGAGAAASSFAAAAGAGFFFSAAFALVETSVMLMSPSADLARALGDFVDDLREHRRRVELLGDHVVHLIERLPILIGHLLIL